MGKFPAVLTRLVKNLHTKARPPPPLPPRRKASRAAAAAQGETFTAEEKEQLCAMFSLNSEQLGQMLEGCTFVFEQFAYNVSKPAATATALDTAGFTEEHVRARPAPCAPPARTVTRG